MKYKELKPGDKFTVVREKNSQIYTKLEKGCTDGVRKYWDYHGATEVKLWEGIIL